MINSDSTNSNEIDTNADMAPMLKKVSADIAFLEDKLQYLHSQKTPNQTVIKIYSDMLSSRESVRAWLSANGANTGNYEEHNPLENSIPIESGYKPNVINL